MLDRKFKVISIILLTVMFVGAFAACANKDDTPEGYQLVACEGDKFRLYVPTQWTPNTTGGVTGAYYSLDENASVHVYIADDAADMTAEEYWNVCKAKLDAEMKGFSASDASEKLTLGGQAARKYVYTAKINVSGQEREYKFMQVLARYDGDMYVLIYSAPTEHYDSHVGEVDGVDNKGIIPYFKFAEPYVSEDGQKEISDKVIAPDGMKLASTEERAYRFFIPSSWIINNRAESTAAYASESDSSNVNVQMYMTGDESQTVEQYWTACEENYKKTFLSYALISTEDIKIDGIDAKQYVISVKVGGQEYKMLQAIVKKGAMFYCITYTATPENYEGHIPEVEKMIESFDIR